MSTSTSTTPGTDKLYKGQVERTPVTFSHDRPMRNVSMSRGSEQKAVFDFLISATMQARSAAIREERTRIAGELHDTLLQVFAGVVLQLHALQRRILTSPHEAEKDLGRVLKVVDVALCDVRSAIWDVRAADLEERDVAATLEQSAREALASHRCAERTAVDLEVTITGERRRLAPDVETAAHLIGREAVTNALRHADAKHIRMAIAFELRHLRVEVRDDGVGFDVAHMDPREGQGRWGVVGMRERARRARGTLNVRSAPRAGTAVVLRVPIDP